jgi:ABC-2 type transport system permease protein
MNKKINRKINSWFNLGAALIIIVLLNFIGGFIFHRFDLTAEKRYSLNPATKKLLKNLDDVVYFKIYLEGDFPSGYKRLRDEFKLMLDQFRAYAGDNIQYTFINPNQSPDPAQQKDFYTQLIKQGLPPNTINVRTEDGEKQQVIFPGALVSFREKTLPLIALKSQIGISPEEMLNNSIQNLEYEIAYTIRKLQTDFRTKIAFIEGHGELGEVYVQDFTQSLREYYKIERVRLNEQLSSLHGFQGAIIAKPDSVFSEKDKFILDQFVMRGGKMMWLIDPDFVSMDSLQKDNETLAIPLDLNLDDQLFRYGARINKALVLDIQSLPIPIITGYVGNQPKQQLFPWYYFPLAFPKSEHPIVKNLNAVKFEFTGSIDTVSAKGVKKTVLLSSSQYSRMQNTPARIDLRMVRKKPDPKDFNRPYRPLAVLLEGEFESIFKNRISPQLAEAPEMNFREKSLPTKMIVVADGDVIRNNIQKSSGKVFPLGYDRYTNQQFGNKNFLLNCINYLFDEEGLLSLRTREIKLRLLDSTMIDQQKNKWQIINIAAPLVLVILLGIGWSLMRKRKYAHN